MEVELDIECDNCSITYTMIYDSNDIRTQEHEWFDVGAWVWNNFDSISGISFLHFSEHTYRQPPYQDCTRKEYEELLKKIPQDVDWTELSNYEQQDYTVASQELACSADGGCEIVDL